MYSYQYSSLYSLHLQVTRTTWRWKSKQTSVEYHASSLHTTNSLVSFSQIFYLFTSCQQANKQHQTSFVKPKLLPLTPHQWSVRERKAADEEWKYQKILTNTWKSWMNLYLHNSKIVYFHLSSIQLQVDFCESQARLCVCVFYWIAGGLVKGDPVEPFSLPSLSKSQLPVFVKFTQTQGYVS